MKTFTKKNENIIHRILSGFHNRFTNEIPVSIVNEMIEKLSIIENSNVYLHDCKYVVFNQKTEKDEKNYLIKIEIEGYIVQEVVISFKFISVDGYYSKTATYYVRDSIAPFNRRIH